MFTGIIERTCRMRAWQQRGAGRRLLIDLQPIAGGEEKRTPWDDLVLGESIAVNGVCLSVVEMDRAIGFDVTAETLRCSTLGDLRPGEPVNLERSLRVGDRLGGHFVTGHVDATGRLREILERPNETTVVVEVEGDGERSFRVIPKGSVAIDGVSLTVQSRSPGRFSVALIPHTLARTNLGARRVGDRVNLESDVIGKWVENLLVP